MNTYLVMKRAVDEGITPMDTNDTSQVDIQGPITRAHARQLNLQVSSFLSNYFCEFENSLLPNNLIILRNKGEDQQERGGRPWRHGGPARTFGSRCGGPNQFDFISVSDSSNNLY